MSKLINELGRKYGRLTVIDRASNGRGGYAQWLCRCECGNEFVVGGKQLRSGKTQSCGCIRIKNELGNRYGRLAVIAQAGTSRWRNVRWLCRCDCGKEVVVRGTSLRRMGGTRSCGCLQREAVSLLEGEASFRQLFSNYWRQAKSRQLEWHLTEADFYELTQQNCYYCRIEPLQVKHNPALNGDFIHNGVDRVDNSKGYIPGNVVPCCATCNMAKRTATEADFAAWICRVYEHWARHKVQ